MELEGPFPMEWGAFDPHSMSFVDGWTVETGSMLFSPWQRASATLGSSDLASTFLEPVDHHRTEFDTQRRSAMTPYGTVTEFAESASLCTPTEAVQSIPTEPKANAIVCTTREVDIVPHPQTQKFKCPEVLSRRNMIDEDDWENHKPIIVQLYIEEEMKLKDVMQVLQIKFDFKASVKMYKSRIAKWGLKKNYTAAEKEQLARVAKRHHDAGEKGLPLLTIGNRPAKLHRVRRYCKERNILETIVAEMSSILASKAKAHSSETYNSSPRTEDTGNGRLIVSAGTCRNPFLKDRALLTSVHNPDRPFSISSDLARVELVLLQTKIHMEWCSSPEQKDSQGSAAGSMSWFENKAHVMRDKLVFGVALLMQQRSMQGFRSINEACQIFRQIVDQPYHGMIRILLNAFEDEGWEAFPEVNIQILRFFTQVSVAKVGCRHPLSILLFHLQNDGVILAVSETALQQMIAILQEDDDEYSANEVCRLEEDYAMTLRRHEKYSAAEYHVRKYLEHYLDFYGRLNNHTCHFLYQLAYMNEELEHWELAESQYEDLLQRSQEVLDADHGDVLSAWALRGLGRLCMRRGDASGAEKKFQDLLRFVLGSWELEDEFTEYFISDIAEVLSGLGIDAEAWLQQYFGVSCI